MNSYRSGNVSDYVAAGKAVSDSAAQSFAVQRKTGPDYGELSKVAMKTGSAEKIAAINASAKMASKGIEAYSDVTKMGQKVAVVNDRIDKFKKTRMAGSIAAVGKIAGAGYLASRDNTKDRPYPTAKEGRDGLMSDHQATIDGINKRRKASADEFSSTIDGIDNSSGGGSTPGKATGGGSVTSPTSGTPTSGIRSQAFNYLTKDKGLSRNKALGIIANVDRESGWDPKIRSGDDGGPGGLFQWKGSRQTPTVRNLVDSGDWKGQLDYALSEPGEAYSQTYQQTTFNSPQEAADGWMTNWERPADTRSGSQKHTGLLGGYSF